MSEYCPMDGKKNTTRDSLGCKPMGTQPQVYDTLLSTCSRVEVLVCHVSIAPQPDWSLQALFPTSLSWPANEASLVSNISSRCRDEYTYAAWCTSVTRSKRTAPGATPQGEGCGHAGLRATSICDKFATLKWPNTVIPNSSLGS